MTRRYRGGHLEDFVDGYVDGRLDAASTRRAAQHLAVCTECRRAVEAERSIVARVRVVPLDPGRHARLVAGLVALEGDQTRGVAGCRRPDETASDARAGIHLVAPNAPARYDRSLRRHAMAALVLAVACGGLVVMSAGHPRSTAPGRLNVASTTRGGDWIDPPNIRDEAARASSSSRRSPLVIEASLPRSGRMAP